MCFVAALSCTDGADGDPMRGNGGMFQRDWEMTAIKYGKNMEKASEKRCFLLGKSSHSF
jgi:hypothetical protein